jgi:hypothetical protein
MSVTAITRHGARRTRPVGLVPRGVQGVEPLVALINRNVAALAGGRDDLVEQVVRVAATAFLDHDGSPDHALPQVAPLLWQLGERHACSGLPPERLDQGFLHALTAAQRGLQFVVLPPGAAGHLVGLREDLTRFIQLLRRQTMTAWERAHVFLEASDDPGRLGPALLRASGRPLSERLLQRAGLDPDTDFVLVVSCDGALPAELLAHRTVVAGSGPREALLPADRADDLLALGPARQVVVGPPARLHAIGQTADLVRRGAELVGDAVVVDDRPVVPCTDLLSALVVAGNPGLTGLIAAKHLAPLEQLSIARRVRTAEMMLRWLETGLPINALARDMGVPQQTAHSRMQRVRGLYGARLDDPTQRLELIIALQSALPRWRAQAGTD